MANGNDGGGNRRDDQDDRRGGRRDNPRDSRGGGRPPQQDPLQRLLDEERAEAARLRREADERARAEHARQMNEANAAREAAETRAREAEAARQNAERRAREENATAAAENAAAAERERERRGQQMRGAMLVLIPILLIALAYLAYMTATGWETVDQTFVSETDAPVYYPTPVRTAAPATATAPAPMPVVGPPQPTKIDHCLGGVAAKWLPAVQDCCRRLGQSNAELGAVCHATAKNLPRVPPPTGAPNPYHASR